MLITLTIIGGSLIFGYYYRQQIAWNSIKLYTYINKSYTENNENNENIKDNKDNEDIIIDDIIYIEYKEQDLTENILYKIKNKDLKIIDNNFKEINNEKININEINIINSKGDITNLKDYICIH